MTAERVLKEFTRWDGKSWYDHNAMAAEIATLRAQLAGVREKAEKLERYIPVEGYFAGRAEMEKCDWGGWCYFDDVLAALGGDA